MKEIVLFGGGILIFNIIKTLLKKGTYKPILFVASRHLNEIVHKDQKLKKLLLKNNISFIETEKLNIKKINSKINMKKYFFALSVGSPWIFNKKIISFLKQRIFNIHGSSLPQDKGGGGFTWQLLQRKKYGYVSIHYLTNKIDEGDIVAAAKFRIKNLENPLEINNLYVKKATKLFFQFLEKIKNKKIRGIKQQKDESTYWPRINSNVHGWVNWDWDGEYINDFIKGFGDPYVGAHTLLKGKEIFLKNSQFIKKYHFHPFQYGLIFRINKFGLWICVKNGCLLIKKYQLNKKVNKENFIKLGDRLYTPQKFLENAKMKRVYYHLKLSKN